MIFKFLFKINSVTILLGFLLGFKDQNMLEVKCDRTVKNTGRKRGKKLKIRQVFVDSSDLKHTKTVLPQVIIETNDSTHPQQSNTNYSNNKTRLELHHRSQAGQPTGCRPKKHKLTQLLTKICVYT